VVEVADFDFDWRGMGAEIEGHPHFPKRTNVSFIRPVDGHTLDVRFYERGAGETMSSGTGSTGAAAAALHSGRVESPVTVLTPAGPLKLRSEVRFTSSARHRLSEAVSSTSRDMRQALEEKIVSRKARVGIVGLGYVGLPLAVEFAKAGFTVTGIDLSPSKVAKVNAGESYIADIDQGVFKSLVDAGKISATGDFGVISELDT
jgi:hypothetical protein